MLQSEQTRGRFVDHMENLREEIGNFEKTRELLNLYFADRLDLLQKNPEVPTEKKSESVYVKQLMGNFEVR